MRASGLVVLVCFTFVRGDPPQQALPLPLPPPPSGYENINFNPNVGVTNFGQHGGPEENQLNYPSFPQQQQQQQLVAEQPNTGPEQEVEAHRPRGHKSYESAEELPTGEEDDDLISEAIPGQPEQDYPVFLDIPKTSFTCSDKTFPGYFADVEARCQVFHICEVGGVKHSFLCPSGSVFNQKYLVCDWWYDFVCENAHELFQDQQELDKVEQKGFEVSSTAEGDSPANTPAVADTQYRQQNPPTDFSSSGQGQNGNYGFPDDGFNLQNNGYFPPNDIFHGAETGVPNRNRNYENENQGTNQQATDNNERQNEQQESKTKETNATVYTPPKRDNNPPVVDVRQRQNVRVNRRGNQLPAQAKPTEQILKERQLDNGNSAKFSGNQYLSSTPETLNREPNLEGSKNNQDPNNNHFPGPVFNTPNYQTTAP